MLADLRHPTVFAHRGASVYAPENTLPAFQLAVEQGADAIELDAKLCADGHVVVFHDPTVDRTTDGSGRVDELSLADLKRLDADCSPDRNYPGTQVPTLEEVFAAFGRKIFINVELRNYEWPDDALPEAVAALVTEAGLEDHVLISSFNPLALARFQQRMPGVPIGLLVPGKRWRSHFPDLPGKVTGYQALHPFYEDVTHELVLKAHRAGQRLHTYTVNPPEVVRQMFALGVDGIFTDDPKLALEIRRNMEATEPDH